MWTESQKSKVAKKEEAERRKIAKLRKQTAMAELTTDVTGVAMMTAYKQLGVFSAPLMALMSINYGIQRIENDFSQKYAKGGIVEEKALSVGVIIKAEGGEAIFSRKATANESVLSGMNKSLSNGDSINEAIAKNLPRANNSGQNKSDMSAMTKMLSGVVDAVKDIKIDVVLHGRLPAISNPSQKG